MKTSLALGLTLTLLLGISQAQTKKTLTVAAWAGNDKLITAVLPGFLKTHPNLEVKVVGGLGYGDYHPALNNRLQSGSAEDVVALGGQFVVDYADGTFFEDLSKAPYSAGASFQRQFVKSQVAVATGVRGNFIAVPNDAPPNVMFYRRDVLKKAGVTPEQLSSSWEGYIAAGKKLKAQGVFITNGAGDVASTAWSANIPSGEGVYFDKDGKPLVDNARFFRAFSLAKQTRDAGLDSKIGGWTPEWYDAFKKGKVATIVVGSWFENILTDQIDKDGAGNWGVTLAPEKSNSVGGGAFFAIPTSSKNKAEAWDLIRYLTVNTKTQAEVFKQSGNFPANLSALREPIFKEASAYFGGQRVRQTYALAARNMSAALPSKNYALAETIINDQLTQVLEQGKDIKTALSEAKALIERRTSR